MIESFEITSQGTVIVIITAANGGKEFVLDAKINDDVAPEVLGVTGTAATEAIGGTGGNADKFLTSLTVTFTEAIQLADSADILDAFTLGSDASTTAVLAEDGKSIHKAYPKGKMLRYNQLSLHSKWALDCLTLKEVENVEKLQ